MPPYAMAAYFSTSTSLTLSPPTPPLLFNPIPNHNPNPNPLSFLKPLSIPTLALTNARKKTEPTESTSTLTIEEDGDDDDEEEEEEFLAFEEMRRWEMKKPAGFGEGKVYDTTVEEKLLEEMERERIAAQVAAEAKKKAKGSSSMKQDLAQKDAIHGPAVRLVNLPKKKNIDRDLRAAFKGFKGILKISPAVAGNWKTRDPVCKGFAFVEFVSEEAAVRFANTYSKLPILFGKVEKQISCDILSPGQPVTSRTQSLGQQKLINSMDETLQEESNRRPTLQESVKEAAALMKRSSSPLSDSEEREVGIEHFKTPLLTDKEVETHVNELSSDSLAVPSQKQEKQKAPKKKVVKRKSMKTAKLNLPSSMAKLKIKERTVLTGVFTKYGGKVASASD